LRISVTDRCNFRCTYCMPKEIFGPDFAFLPATRSSASRRSSESHARLSSSAWKSCESPVASHLSGATSRPHRDARSAPAPDGQALDLTLTTNGSGLRRLAGPLRDAGLQRVTVSLDSLDDAVFAEMNGVEFPVAKVLDGSRGGRGGLAPIKINMVVRRGSMKRASCRWPLGARCRPHLRFIEYMDVGTTNGWRLDDVVPAADVVAAIDAAMPLEPLPAAIPRRGRNAVALPDGSGEVGLIASVSAPFCGDCTRARISAEGKLYTCSSPRSATIFGRC